MRLTTKTAVTGLGVAVAVLVTGAVAFYALESIRAIERGARNSAMAIAQGNIAHARLEAAGSGLAKFVATGDEQFAAIYVRGRDEFEAALAAIEHAERSQADEEETTELSELAGYAGTFRNWVRTVAEPALQARRQLPSGSRGAPGALIDDQIIGLRDGVASYVARETHELESRIAQSDRMLNFTRLMLLGPGVLTLLSHGLAASVVMRMVRSVRAMQAGAGAIRKGDLSMRVAVERNDELGDLAHAMNSMVERLEQVEERTVMMDEFKLLLAGCSKAEDAHVVAAQFTKRAFPDWAGAIYLLDPTRSHAQAVSAWGGIPEGDIIESGACWALKVGRIHDVPDMAVGVPCEHLSDPPPAWSVCVPMVTAEEVIGFFHVACPTDAPRSVTLSGRQVAEAMAEHLARTLADLRMRQALREQAILDPLTQLFNRRYLGVTLERAILRSRRSKEAIGVMVIDIDFFKRINDNFGHAAGDAVLVAVSRLMKTSARGEDIPCRFGGEEFLLVMIGASRHDTQMRAEQLRKTIEALALEHGGAKLGAVTISVGVAAFPDDGDTPEAIIRAADLALFAAKRDGRNRVALAAR